MLSSNRVRGTWWAYTALTALLAAGCVSAASEESGGGVPDSGAEGREAPVLPSLVDGEPGGSVAEGVSVGGGDTSSVSSTSSTLLDVASILSEEFRDALVYDRPDFSGYSDEAVLALAFHHRALLRDDPWGFDLNDLSTSLGALCWIILNAHMIAPIAMVEQVLPSPPYGGYANLRVWHIEREVEDRGLELFWESGPVNDMLTLRRLLLKARELRGVVFGSDLPLLLRPLAEELYVWVDDLWELPVVRVRPTLEKLASGNSGSPYRGLEGITEEEIARIWPEEFEVELTDEGYKNFFELIERLRGDEEVRDLLNAGCEFRMDDWYAGACPAWVADVLPSECRTAGVEPECPFGDCASEEGSGLND